jgi:hypothetical protein
VLYNNSDKIQTNCQIALLIPFDLIAIIPNASCGYKISDYVLLKTDKIYIVFKKQIKMGMSVLFVGFV